jgi:hypothetical protein
MKRVIGPICLLAVLTIEWTNSAFALAQARGLRPAMTQPGPARALTAQANPTVPAQAHGSIFVGQPMTAMPPEVSSIVSIVPTFPTVIVPNTVLLPGQTVVPPAPVTPAPSAGLPFQHSGGFGQQVHHRVPGIGTPRSEVIRQFGAPSVTIITATGETLYVDGGVTVMIQNDQLVGTK